MKELIAIQSELKAPKDLYNKFGNYKYRSAESILSAVKPLLTKLGCTLTLSDDVVGIDGWKYIKATATLTNSDGDSVSVTAYAREAESKKGMDSSQVTGATSSYARKYALNGMFAIDDTKDADTNEYHDQTKDDDSGRDSKTKDDKALTDAEKKVLIKEIERLAEIKKTTGEKLAKSAGFDSLEDMPDKRLEACRDYLKTL